MVIGEQNSYRNMNILSSNILPSSFLYGLYTVQNMLQDTGDIVRKHRGKPRSGN